MADHPEAGSILTSLHPRIRRILRRLGWRSFREVQVRAYWPIFEGKSTLICAPTASGKTEAAFLPLFNKILTDGAEPLFCLYVSPLRALLDDCYGRLKKWTEGLGLDIAVRHGERQTDLAKLAAQPPHVLMTTPESLEVILAFRKPSERQNLFRNLQAVVVDEVHNFIRTQRGAQLSALLVRLREYCEEQPQIIGLSATVGAPDAVMAWLASSARETEIIEVGGGHSLAYGVALEPDDDQLVADVVSKSDKTLIFVPSRAAAETLASRLKGHYKKFGKQVYVHHSSLDGQLKRESQESFRERSRGIMTATSTLELGIDIGDLDLVVHFHPPNSADSFLQRSGRTGRRGRGSVLVVAHSTAELLIGAAQVSLALRREVEPYQPLRRAYDIVLQQLLAMVLEHHAVPLELVVRVVREAPAFADITAQELQDLIAHCCSEDILELSGNRKLTMGIVGEHEFGSKNFIGVLSTIWGTWEFRVVTFRERKDVGALEARFALMLDEGDEFLLAGEPWRVKAVDVARSRVIVEPGSREEPPKWSSGVGGLTCLVASEAWRLLTQGIDGKLVRCLSPSSARRLGELHAAAKALGFTTDLLPVWQDPDDQKRWWYLTFGGHYVNALFRDIARRLAGASHPKITGFAVSLKHEAPPRAVWETVAAAAAELTDAELAQFVARPRPLTRFSRYLPPEYQTAVCAELSYDLAGLRQLTKRRFVELEAAKVEKLAEQLTQ